MTSLAYRIPLFAAWSLFLIAGAVFPTAARATESESGLLATIATGALRTAADYRFHRWARDRFWDDEAESRYGLQFEDDWQAVATASPRRPLVVLVHGFNSSPQRNAAVLEPIRAAGYPCASFAYPNDSDLCEAAASLSQQLKSFAAEHPQQKVALVTHSMGGLVARACLEDAALDPGNVTRLVMIAPPTHGTQLAHLAVATDIWEHWLSRADGSGWTRFRDSIVDGLGEAADDLVPGSPFLTALNARPRNPAVRYSLLLGTGASAPQQEVETLRIALQTSSGWFPSLRGYSEKAEQLLGDMDEIVDGKGDGVVAVERGRLDGVADAVILPFGHLACTGPADSDAVKQVQSELLSRLQ